MSTAQRLEAHEVTVRLGGRLAVDRVSLALTPGVLTAVIGPNGAGKSTLLRALAGLLRPASGHVALGGRPIAALRRLEIARAIAFLPQERVIHWPLPVRAVVGLGRLPLRNLAAGETEADLRAIAAAIADLDLAGLADRPVDRLSGGERARVLLARALAQETPILIADEPAASLDPAHQVALFERLGRLAVEGRAIAVAVHDLSVAVRYCSEAVLMVGGRLVAAGMTADVMTPERLSAAFGIDMVAGVVDGLPVLLPRQRVRRGP